MAEWIRTDLDFATRVGRLNGDLTGGELVFYWLNASTVKDDNAADMLTGNSGQDWFLFNEDGVVKDKATDMSTFESMFAEDIDFIFGS